MFPAFTNGTDPFIGFNCTDDENMHSLATLRRRAWQALRAKVDEQIADAAIISKLRAHFEERFRYDEAGIPRVWRPDDDIDGTFKVAKDNVSFPLGDHPLTKRTANPASIDPCSDPDLLQNQTRRHLARVLTPLGTC